MTNYRFLRINSIGLLGVIFLCSSLLFATENNNERVPSRLFMFLLDQSGSLSTKGLQQLKKAVDGAREELRPDDFYNISAFDERIYVIENTTLKSEFDKSDDPLNRVRFRGKWSILYDSFIALHNQARILTEKGKYSPVIILISDGFDEKSLSTLEDAKAANSYPIPLIIFAIKGNKGINHLVFKELAETAKSGEIVFTQKDLLTAVKAHTFRTLPQKKNAEASNKEQKEILETTGDEGKVIEEYKERKSEVTRDFAATTPMKSSEISERIADITDKILTDKGGNIKKYNAAATASSGGLGNLNTVTGNTTDIATKKQDLSKNPTILKKEKQENIFSLGNDKIILIGKQVYQHLKALTNYSEFWWSLNYLLLFLLSLLFFIFKRKQNQKLIGSTIDDKQSIDEGEQSIIDDEIFEKEKMPEYKTNIAKEIQGSVEFESKKSDSKPLQDEEIEIGGISEALSDVYKNFRADYSSTSKAIDQDKFFDFDSNYAHKIRTEILYILQNLEKGDYQDKNYTISNLLLKGVLEPANFTDLIGVSHVSRFLEHNFEYMQQKGISNILLSGSGLSLDEYKPSLFSSSNLHEIGHTDRARFLQSISNGVLKEEKKIRVQKAVKKYQELATNEISAWEEKISYFYKGHIRFTSSHKYEIRETFLASLGEDTESRYLLLPQKTELLEFTPPDTCLYHYTMELRKS